MTDNKRPTPDELRNTQDATFTTGEGKAPELGVKNASTEGSTYRPLCTRYRAGGPRYTFTGYHISRK